MEETGSTMGAQDAGYILTDYQCNMVDTLEARVGTALASRNSCRVVGVSKATSPLKEYKDVNVPPTIGPQPLLPVGVASRSPKSKREPFKRGTFMLDCGAAFTMVSEGWCSAHNVAITEKHGTYA